MARVVFLIIAVLQTGNGTVQFGFLCDLAEMTVKHCWLQ